LIQHHILEGSNYAYIEVRQAPPLAEFLRAARLFISDQGFSDQLHRICDFSQANLSHITQGDLIKFVHFASTRIRLHPSAKCALVAPDDHRGGVFASFAQHMKGGNIKVFQQPEDAVEWVTQQASEMKFDKILGGVA
jgi:hypothetical protein